MSERSMPCRIARRVKRAVTSSVVKRRTRATVSSDRYAYPGVCSICGESGQFTEPRNAQFAARSFPCASCGGVLRFRNEAAAIIDELGRGRHLSLASLIPDKSFASVSVYNTGIAGPVRSALRSLANYVESTFWEDAVPGEVRGGIQHQDLCALTFGDAAFDLVTSSHVLEHVSDPAAAFAELARVLRPGGRLIFSIPIAWPPPPVSVSRAALRNGEVEHLLPPVFHESPGGSPSLVFTDFGSDLLDLLNDVGFHTRQQRPHMGVEFAFRDSVFVGIKR
jgi:SAM-dependent methyltransferase